MKDNVKCNSAKHEECFARSRYTNGACTILNNADFGGRECPFFKTDAEYEAGIRKYGDGRDYIAAHSKIEKED